MVVVVVVGETSFEPRAGGGSVNASSREERLGGSFGGRSSDDWGVGGRMGRGMVLGGVVGATVVVVGGWWLVVVMIDMSVVRAGLVAVAVVGCGGEVCK